MALQDIMTNEAPVRTTMRETEANCNGETDTLVSIARLLREEVDRRVDLDADYAERGRAMHEVANDVVRCVHREDLQEIADRFDTAEVILEGKVYRQHEEASPARHSLTVRCRGSYSSTGRPPRS